MQFLQFAALYTCPLVPPVSYDETATATVLASNYDTGLQNKLQFVVHRRLDFENLASHRVTKTTLCVPRMIWICKRINVISLSLLLFSCIDI